MTVSDVGQARVFLINVLFGMACVLVFDFFRALRRKHKENVVYANVLDAIYFIAAFFMVLFASLKFNFGAVRYYQILGLMIGAFLHILLFSRFEVRIFEYIITAAETGAKLILHIVLCPFIFIMKLIIPLLLAFERNSMKFFAKIAKKRGAIKKKKRQNKKILKKRIKMM